MYSDFKIRCVKPVINILDDAESVLGYLPSAQKDIYIMKIRDIINVVDIDSCPADVFIAMLRDMQAMPEIETLADREAFMAIMYGDEAEDLRIEQQREDLRKTRAQADKLRADADRARAEADARRAGG
ncbi:hypothetical protein MKK67_19505 [Methylobacterium sp. J-072]|uniref:hypothetical protein n=1 Tax=Methylobacterium sp. J-072 TaxID=2836651 RepID=UPI001FBABF39|nr:hypothetical protein [Methylobacterium sp. J-072]MCJ2094664.1 hypothetical protein [Methylobacterium sp. J-072]